MPIPAAVTSGLIKIGGDIIEKLIPDEKERRLYNLRLIQMDKDGELQLTQERMKAIITEAQSDDRFVSRARPAFLYVIYIMILAGPLMGFLYIFSPEKADAMIKGVTLWLNGFPGELWAVFGSSYLGYSAFRSFDKSKKLLHKG